jgi:heavy metal sensor kinase
MMRTLRARLATIAAIVFGLLLAGLSLASYQVLARRLDADVTERLTALTDGLHGYLRFGPDAASVVFDAADNDQAVFVHEATRYYQVYDVATGRLVAASSGMAPLGLQLTLDEIRTFRARPEPFDIATEYGRLRLSNSVRTLPDGRTYLLQVGISLEPMDAALKRYRDLLWWRVPIAVVLGALAAWWLSGFALRPLSRLAASARLVDVNALDRRVPVRGVGDELDRVAAAFNETLERLQHAVVEMRQFSSALAHELRTPLAALRGEIELALREPGLRPALQESYGSQIEEIDHLTRLIDQILTLARAEAGQIRLTVTTVDLGQLAASIVDQLQPLAEARSIDLACEGSAALAVQGDPAWLQRLFLNLLDNALKYTPAGGRVTVRVSRDGDRARLDVQDTGAGLSAADLPRVFERFFRADPARSSSLPGAGLGLSLVQWIVAQHRGHVTVQSTLGQGSTFTVTLPMVPRGT